MYTYVCVAKVATFVMSEVSGVERQRVQLPVEHVGWELNGRERESKKKTLTDSCGLPAEADAGFISNGSKSAVAAAVSFLVIMVTRAVVLKNGGAVNVPFQFRRRTCMYYRSSETWGRFPGYPETLPGIGIGI